MDRKKSANEPDVAEIAGWALQKIATGDYHFTPCEFDSTAGEHGIGRWELTIWEWDWDSEPMPPGWKPDEERSLADLVLKPEFLLQLRELCGDEAIHKFLKVFSRELGRHFIDMRQRLVPKEHAASESFLHEKHPEVIRNLITSEFLRRLGGTLPKLTSRSEQLRALSTESDVPKDVQLYLEEASQCYTYGQFIACLIVCRSAIEFALRDRLKQEDAIEKLIAYGRDRFSWTLKPTLDFADEVRIAANRAVHHGAPPADICRGMFDKTRGVLRDLYSAQNPWGSIGATSTG
jgi:hypothetical protein